ncbi:TRAP transporter substrate-binding protein DctP [Microbacterium lacus]|uniref:TRAP transporter substrate-binding protein DctP n=1 Tax=Microbacterium lacus TaxID=415217 RepID=UPI00384E2C08
MTGQGSGTVIARRAFIVLAGACGAIALLVSCSGGNATPSATSTGATADVDWSSIDPVELTVSNPFAPGNVSSQLLRTWMDTATKATDGKVTFDYYESGALHGVPESLSALNSGLTDVTFIASSYFPDQLPVSNWWDQLIQGELQKLGYPGVTVAGSGQQLVQYESESAAAAEQAEAGFISFIPLTAGPNVLTCVEEFDSVEDLEGRTVRVSGALTQGEMESMGMSGTFMPTTDQYEGLQRGVLDCAVNAPTTIVSTSLLDVTPWVSFIKSAPTVASWAISTDTWDGLAPEIQEVLTEARYDAVTGYVQDSMDEFKDLAAAVEEAGGEIIDASEFNPTIDGWWADQPELASLAPSAVLDPEAEIDRARETMDAWWELTTGALGVESPDDVRESLGEGSAVVEDWGAWRDALADGLGEQ